jgi:ECF sigma factor
LPDDVLALDEALTRFATEEPAKAELVKLRFFAGLSTPEAASALAVERTRNAKTPDDRNLLDTQREDVR